MNRLNPTLRNFEPGDEEAYVAIWNDSFKACSWYQKHGPATVEVVRRNIEQNFKKPSYKLVFAFSEEKPVGFIEMEMKNAETGRIFPYRPCVLSTYRQQGFGSALVKAALKHLQRCGAGKVEFSIMGCLSDTEPYVSFYDYLNFHVWRVGQSMRRSLRNLPALKSALPLRLLTATKVPEENFVDLFIKCFKNSKDRDASRIASSFEKTREFVASLREREGKHHDPEGWIVAECGGRFVGFAVALSEDQSGLIAEVGVVPPFRRRGVGKVLSLKAMKRLKERGFTQVFLGVDIQNEAAMSLYSSLGFEKVQWMMFDLEKLLA